jgi:hypothetical protein
MTDPISLCVFCGAKPGRDPSHQALARAVGAAIAAYHGFMGQPRKHNGHKDEACGNVCKHHGANKANTLGHFYCEQGRECSKSSGCKEDDSQRSGSEIKAAVHPQGKDGLSGKPTPEGIETEERSEFVHHCFGWSERCI